jgi:23S rRNA pseudouridine1911/1915/1917 synthase
VRQALHAYRLAFRHPVTDQAMRFESALPEDFSAALRQWGLRYNAAQRPDSRPPG